MNPSKAKGDRFELAVAKALRVLGFPYAERSRAGWDDDRGDINAAPGLVIQCKDAKDKRWNVWLAELSCQRASARARHGILVVKRLGMSDPASALAVMRLDDMALLLREAGYGQPVDTDEAGAA